MATAAVALWSVACANPPEPIRYVAKTRPERVPLTVEDGGMLGLPSSTEKRIRFGILYRAPVDVPAVVERLEREREVRVLRFVDFRFQTPFCFTFFCIGRDEFRVGQTADDSDRR